MVVPDGKPVLRSRHKPVVRRKESAMTRSHIFLAIVTASVMSASSLAFGASPTINHGFQFTATADEGHKPDASGLKDHPRPDCPGLTGTARDNCMKTKHSTGHLNRGEGNPTNQGAVAPHPRPDCPGLSGAALEKCMSETHAPSTSPNSPEGKPRN